MDQDKPKIRSNTPRRAMAAVFFVLLVSATGLWLFTSGIFCRPQPKPSLAVRAPRLLLQATALDNGVHHLCLWQQSNRHTSIQFDRVTYLGNAGYRHGFVASFLGFTFAILKQASGGTDYIVSPHAAVVLPYWFLIIISSLGFLWFSGIGRLLASYCRFSRFSWWLMGITMLVFLTLNCVPSAWRLGAAIRPDSVTEWLNLTFSPSTYPEICLSYGFPFVCYQRGIINGKSVQIFHGYDTLGLHQHRMMENLCIMVASCMAAGMLVEVCRRRRG